MKNAGIILMTLILFIITGCGPGRIAVKLDPYIGDWNMLIEDTPQGDVSSMLVILKSDDGYYTGSLNSDMGTFELNNLKIIDNKLSAIFYVQDMDFDLIGNFENNSFNGYVSGMGVDFKANGTKVLQKQL